MPTDLSTTLIFIARLLLGGAFVIFAVRNWRFSIPRLSGILEKRNIANARQLVTAGIVLQFVGGLLAAIGPFPAIGGALMIVFLVIATVLFHPAWEYSGEERGPHTAAVLINSALSGGFLLLIAIAI